MNYVLLRSSHFYFEKTVVIVCCETKVTYTSASMISSCCEGYKRVNKIRISNELRFIAIKPFLF